MESKLIFIRRTKQEEEIFGGIVYVDVDGKNIGQLSTQDLIYELLQENIILRCIRVTNLTLL